ncbi:phthiocerol/phthiodiolone dimycocerosyl transferase family protein [Streptomyces nojiriensis]|uniref:phthiocerol/phthiodiolone dimycocerosyl transferase family protein n=1 Tax=Streptomyces nojiriensis TaxID=66374 RepID=UPI0036537645
MRHYGASGQRLGLIDLGHGACHWWAAMSTPDATPSPNRLKDGLRRAYAGWADEVRAVAEDAVVLTRTPTGTTGEDPASALRTDEERRRERTGEAVAESRRISDLAQGARIRRRLVRSAHFRLAPRHALTQRTAQDAPDGPATKPSSVHRELSPLERLYWIADRTSPLNVIARVRVHGHLPPSLHRSALDTLQLRHPLLRVAIADDGTGEHPAFVPLDGRQIPLRFAHVPPDDPMADTRWEHEVNDCELVESVDWRAGPLLRAVVITSGGTGGDDEGHVHDLLLTASHIIADGKTCLSLVREWIEVAAQLDCGSQPPATPRRALPATDDLLPPRHRGAAGVAGFEAMMRREQQAARGRPAQRVVPSHQVPFEQRRTRMVHRFLTAEQLELLVTAAKRHGTTVHGVLAAAMVTAVARDAGTSATALFSIGSPVDFRSDLEPAVSPDEVGTYVATVPSRVRYEPGRPLWSMARAITRDLVRRRRRQEHLATISLPRWTGPKSLADSEPFMRFMDEKGPINLCLSNVGRYEFPDRAGSWRVGEAQFLTGVSVMGAIVAAATTSHTRLAWNFSYVDGLIPTPRARRIADDSVRTVLSALAK